MSALVDKHDESSSAASEVARDGSSSESEADTPAVLATPKARTTRNSWTEAECTQLEALEGQLTKLFAGLWVPSDLEKGSGEALATEPADRSTFTLVDYTGAANLPVNRVQTFNLSYTFSGNDRQYVITLLKRTDGPIPVLAPEPFKIERVHAHISRGALGRAYTGAQGYYPNPDYKGKPVAPANGELKDVDVREFKNKADAESNGFESQTASADEPYVFCVPDKKTFKDPKQSAAPSQQRTRYTKADIDGPGANLHARSMVTQRPSESRHDAKRNPQAEAGNTPASSFMGAVNQQDQLASHEYCHLIGDGDSGECSPMNLVLGTNQVNTEQLAMEETLRAFRPEFRKLGWSTMIDTKATTGATPKKASDIGAKTAWPQDQMAIAISYSIILWPADKALDNTNHRIPVHTQIMDGQRGTITALEVKQLQQALRAKLDETLKKLTTAQAGIALQNRWRTMEAPIYKAGPIAEPSTPAGH